MNFNPLGFSMTTLEIKSPRCDYLPQQLISEIIQRLSPLDEAKRRLDFAYEEARKVLSNAEDTATQIINSAYESIATERETMLNAARIEVASKSIQWICDETNLEKEVMKMVNSRWESAIRHVLNIVFTQSNQADILFDQIKENIDVFINSDRISLFVSPNVLLDAKKRFSTVQQLQVVDDATLSDDEAILDNGLIRLRFNLHEWKEEILQQFSDL